MKKIKRTREDVDVAGRILPAVTKDEGEAPRILDANAVPLGGAYKVGPGGKIVHARRNVEATTVAGRNVAFLECPFCGEVIKYGAVNVDEREAKLVFRSQKVGGVWFFAAKGHSGAHCPNPPPETAVFWRDDALRSSWIKRERERRAEGKKR